MIRNHFTIEHCAREITLLNGAIVTGCFSQQPNVLMLSLQQGRQEIHIECNTDPIYSAIFLRPQFARARKNVRPFFPELHGRSLIACVLHPSDRILTLSFSDDYILELRLFGGAKSNMYFSKNGSAHIDCFKGNYEPVTSSIATRWTEFPGEISIAAALAKSALLLGEFYAREVCRRAGYAPDATLGSLSYAGRNDIQNHAVWLIEECRESPLCYILRNKEHEKATFSLLPLGDFPIVEWRGDSVSEGIRRTIGLRSREITIQTRRSRIYAHLARERDKLLRTLEMMKSDAISDERSQQHREWAELLLGQPNTGERVGDTIVVKDWHGNLATISLNPRLTLAENAGALYEKSRNSQIRSEMRRNRVPMFNERLHEINRKIELLSTVYSDDILENLTEYDPDNTGNRLHSSESKYRVFDLHEGYTVYVGKNAKNNDELTVRFAKPQDYWFHARGVSGSHVVLRGGNPKVKPPKRVIEQTAAIAAYYSQHRKGGFVPVAYTQKKYVRKPKGANAGAVVMEREEVILVHPKLPSEQ